MKVKKVVVTGGAGFIGSHLVDLLCERGYEVVVLDDLSTGKRENVNPLAKLYEVDISGDLRNFISFFKGACCVFHLAAWARVPRSIEDPVGTNKANVIGTLNILQACRQLMIPKLVYSSSSSVYGLQDDYLMKEDMAHNPLSPYALQKSIGEQYCNMFSRLYNMKIYCLRYFNVYGPRQLTQGAYTLVIGKFIEQLKQGKKMTIFGDGTQTRAYTWVGDVAKANLLAMEKEPPIKTPFYSVALNIGTNEETSVNDIAKMLGGEYEHIIPNPRGDFEEKRKAADFAKAKAFLQWEPTIYIKEGIQKVLAYENFHPNNNH